MDPPASEYHSITYDIHKRQKTIGLHTTRHIALCQSRVLTIDDKYNEKYNEKLISAKSVA